MSAWSFVVKVVNAAGTDIGTTLSAIAAAIGATPGAAPASSIQVGMKTVIAPLTPRTDTQMGSLTGDATGKLFIYGSNTTDGVIDTSIKNWPQNSPIVYAAIDTLFNSNTAVSSAAIDISTAKRVAILIRSVIDRTAATPQVIYTVTLAAAAGGTHIAFDILMSNAGEDAPVANVTHASASDATLTAVVYLPLGFTATELKVVATSSACAAGETLDSDVWVIVQP